MADIQKLKSLIADWESTSDDIPFGLDEDDRIILEAMKFAADNHDIAARLEAAEANIQSLNRQMWQLEKTGLEHKERAEAAEAHLAELAKQEPVAYTDAEELEIMRKGTFADMFTPDDSYKSDPQWIPLFTRAAPPAPVKLPDLSPLDRLAGKFLQRSVDSSVKVSKAYAECAHLLATEVKSIRAAGGSVADNDNTAQQYEALAGWKMVPIDPTEEMVAAWRKDMNQSYAREFSEKIGEDEVVFAYQAMLEAVPKPEG